MSYIVVEGPIGVGKTTLTKLLAERLNMSLLLEEIDSDSVKRFLSNFYVDRARYAFQTEVFFLLNRYRQQESPVKPAAEKGDLAADYLFAKTRLFAGMNLAGDELKLFEQIYQALAEQVAKPDLVVYLRASVGTLMDRIYRRDRWFERSIDRDYIARLAEVYESFFDSYKESPLIRIDTDKLDFVADSEAQREIINAIRSAHS